MTTWLRHFLQYKIGDNTGQFVEEPSTDAVDLIPASPVRFRPSPEYRQISRAQHQTSDGEKLPSMRGVKAFDLGDLSLPMEGLSGDGAGGDELASDLDSTVWPIVEVLAGGVQASSGVGNSNTPGSGTTLNVAAGDGANVAPGDALLINPSGGLGGADYIAREVVSVATDAITLDRGLTEKDGTAVTPRASTTSYGARTAFFDNDNHLRKHLYFLSEFPSNAREYYGCMPQSARIAARPGEQTVLELGGIRCTDWDNIAVAGAAYSAPTTGNPIVGNPIYLWIGSDLFIVSDLVFDFGLDVQPRPHHDYSGHLGFVFGPAMPSLSGRMTIGTLTAPKEATLTLMDTWRGAQPYTSTTFDVAWQIGTRPGGTLYCRMPAFRFDSLSFSEANGLEVMDFTGTATKSANHANAQGAARLHLM